MRGSKVAIILQFSKNGCSADAKPDSEMTRNWGKVVAYGHVYQFSFYIKIISTSESVVICGLLTGYVKSRRSETIPTEADIYVRRVGAQTSRVDTYSSTSYSR